MNVMVTGAFGYFGLALVRSLAAAGCAVLATGRPPRPRCASAVKAAIPAGVIVVEKDATALKRADLEGIGAIVHVAGGGASGTDMADSVSALHDNVETAQHVAWLASSAGLRLVLASSIYVYGNATRPLLESDPCAPGTLYGGMKLAAERAWRQAGGLALRFAHIYGAGSGVDFGREGVTERLARSVIHGAEFHLEGYGLQPFDLVHIDDACAAVWQSLNAGRDAFGLRAINIGGGPDWLTVRDVAAVFGVEPAQERSEPPEPGRYMAIDCAAAEIGWRPAVPLSVGAAGLIRALRC